MEERHENDFETGSNCSSNLRVCGVIFPGLV